MKPARLFHGPLDTLPGTNAVENEPGKLPLIAWWLALPQEAVEFAAGRVERALLFLRGVVRKQWSAFVIECRGDQILDGPPSELRCLPEFADEFATQKPEIVSVLAQRLR